MWRGRARLRCRRHTSSSGIEEVLPELECLEQVEPSKCLFGVAWGWPRMEGEVEMGAKGESASLTRSSMPLLSEATP